MRNYSRISQGVHPFFPAVMLKLNDEDSQCPFLGEEGCRVYEDRPSSCRTYPLERAVDRNPGKLEEREFYFLTDHPYCLGHKEKSEFTVNEWIRNQRIYNYNLMNDLWAEVDTLFASNPWRGEGIGGAKQQMAFMVCYNIDGFRQFVNEQKIFEQFRLSKDWRKRMKVDDVELLKFGFEWLKKILGGKTSLITK